VSFQHQHYLVALLDAEGLEVIRGLAGVFHDILEGEAALALVVRNIDHSGLVGALFSQRVNDAVKPLLPDCLHLSCGGCNLCERCAKLDDQPCRLPDKALPPMEGYGIDVYNTTKPTDLKYINGQNTVTYFGIVLF
jgi:hypothetical protein